jgi:hypothetical protein
MTAPCRIVPAVKIGIRHEGGVGIEQPEEQYSKVSYSGRERSFWDICRSASKGCDACTLVPFIIGTNYGDGRRVHPEDYIGVLFQRWEAKDFPVLRISD